ncbi:MAG: hypothetical protein ACREAA_10730 [Candidatus Polarisedimenticolia bacterium]
MATTRTPASVRWGLMLMGALLLSQVVGLRWVGPAGQAAGLHAAPLAASPASISIAPSCGSSRDSLEHERALEVASAAPSCGSKPACGAVPRPTPPRRSC